MKIFEYGYPHSNALLKFELKLELCKPHKAAHHPTKCHVNNDVRLFLTVYCRIMSQLFYVIESEVSLQT